MDYKTIDESTISCDDLNRIPNNTHPLYGSFSYHNEPYLEADLTISRASSHMTELSRTQSFRTAVESMADSFSRASVMYMAENLPLSHPSNHYSEQEDDSNYNNHDNITKK
jgi:hypothetical protein